MTNLFQEELKTYVEAMKIRKQNIERAVQEEALRRAKSDKVQGVVHEVFKRISLEINTSDLFEANCQHSERFGTYLLIREKTGEYSRDVILKVQYPYLRPDSVHFGFHVHVSSSGSNFDRFMYDGYTAEQITGELIVEHVKSAFRFYMVPGQFDSAHIPETPDVLRTSTWERLNEDGLV